MKIIISPESRIREVKAVFNKRFPYLKLEFFSKKHAPGQGNPKSQMLPDNATLIDVTGVMRAGEIEIRPANTVTEVEQLFQKKFNLPVQVFRKSGNAWLETMQTDGYTLMKQNHMGKASIQDKEILL